MSELSKKSGSALGGALIIAGTCIGGGMLVLPVIPGVGGLYYSLLLFVACWLFMAATALLLFEVCLWMGKETNIVSMAGRTLGPWGRGAAWALYLFLFYSLTTAYCTGGGSIVKDLSGLGFSPWTGSVLFVLAFAPFVAMGAIFVDRINRWCVLGMALALSGFIALGLQEVDIRLWEHMDVRAALWGLPVIFGSFGFQGTVPSLVHYLRADEKKVRFAIIFGSSIPLLTYVVWQALILGVVDADALLAAQKVGMNAVQPLKDVVQSQAVYTFGQFFAIFALISSFLGVTLGLKDFIADGFGIKKTPLGRVYIALLTFGPPLCFALLGPQIFTSAMQYAGGIGVALLLGLMPVLIVWRGRYSLGFEGRPQLGGGRIVLVLLIAFVCLELACEVWQLL